MAHFGNPGRVNAEYAFEKSFGTAVSNDETYYDPWMGVDKRKEIGQHLLEKASVSTTTGGAGTAGYALIPVWVDPQVVDKTRRLTPLVELIPRRATKGTTYDYNVMTAKGGAAFLGEDAPLADQTDTYDRATIAIKYLYAVGRVTGPAIAGMRGFNDALSMDLQTKIRSVKEAEENEIVNGNTTTNPNGYQGLIQTISTNTTDLSSAYVTLTIIRTELATTCNANGIVTLAVTDAGTHNYIKGLLMDYQRFIERPTDADMPFGISDAFMIDGVTFIKDRYMPTTSNSRRILFLDMRYLFMAVLQEMTYEELAKTNDSNKYMLKVYEALVVTFEGAMSQIYGIT